MNLRLDYLIKFIYTKLSLIVFSFQKWINIHGSLIVHTKICSCFLNAFEHLETHLFLLFKIAAVRLNKLLVDLLEDLPVKISTTEIFVRVVEDYFRVYLGAIFLIWCDRDCRFRIANIHKSHNLWLIEWPESVHIVKGIADHDSCAFTDKLGLSNVGNNASIVKGLTIALWSKRWIGYEYFFFLIQFALFTISWLFEYYEHLLEESRHYLLHH